MTTAVGMSRKSMTWARMSYPQAWDGGMSYPQAWDRGMGVLSQSRRQKGTSTGEALFLTLERDVFSRSCGSKKVQNEAL